MQHKCCLDQTAHREKNSKEAANSGTLRQRKVSGHPSSVVRWFVGILKQQQAYLSYKILYIAK